MDDEEIQSPQSSSRVMSLRKRRNPQPLSPISPPLKTEARKQHLRRHSKLVKEINSANGDDDEDDEEAKEMKKMIMDYSRKHRF